ncbi:hypothetical protein LPB41_02465 [Thalassospira sp. MA62]|nr:hypothetical protein [Thalassospira sp. MA62]
MREQRALTKLIATLSFVTILFGSGIVQANQSATGPLRLPVRESEFELVQSCQNDSNPDCRSCLADTPTNTSLVLYSILQNALIAGGVDTPIELVPSPNSERGRKMISEGDADIKSDWDFNIALDPNVLKSAAFIASGEFEKGVYVREDTLMALAGVDMTDVGNLRAVTLRNWRLDWKVMEDLGPQSLVSAATTDQIYAMINAGRADFTLLEFSSEPGMIHEFHGVTLSPLPGIKVALPGSQHFMISSQTPQAKEIVAKLNDGIEALHQSGLLRQCLVNGGILHEKTRDWRVLTPRHGNPPTAKIDAITASN